MYRVMYNLSAHIYSDIYPAFLVEDPLACVSGAHRDSQFAVREVKGR